MRDPKRIWPFLSKLAELWELKPDYRFWQLLQSIPLDRDPFFIEEAETEAILDKEIAEIKAWQKKQQEKYKSYKLTPREEAIAKLVEYTNCNKEE